MKILKIINTIVNIVILCIVLEIYNKQKEIIQPPAPVCNSYDVKLDIANGYTINVDVDLALNRAKQQESCGHTIIDPGDPIQPIPVPDLACPPPRRLICR